MQFAAFVSKCGFVCDRVWDDVMGRPGVTHTELRASTCDRRVCSWDKIPAGIQSCENEAVRFVTITHHMTNEIPDFFTKHCLKKYVCFVRPTSSNFSLKFMTCGFKQQGIDYKYTAEKKINIVSPWPNTHFWRWQFCRSLFLDLLTGMLTELWSHHGK